MKIALTEWRDNMKLIRRETFETNSSSTHSITMCKESDFDKWKNGELYYCNDDGKFYNDEERSRLIKEHIIYNRAKYDNGNYTYKDVTVDYEDLNKLYTEENLAEITEEEIAKYMEEDFDYYELPITYGEWDEYFEYEKYEDSYTTPNGETVVAFGYYGYN